jgi:Domain of unknown function DUF29
MQIKLSVAEEKKLYESDFYLWLQTTVNFLKKGDFTEIDLPNLIAEIEAMVKQQKNSLKSNLRILLMHLLKWKYQKTKRTNSWLYTIREHRTRIKDDLEDSPSLQNYYVEIFAHCYKKAREFASDETGMNINHFPADSPFIFEQILDDDYLPE